MIKVKYLDDSPMSPGDSRELVLTGDGPFEVTASCFVDKPRPPGFRPCEACSHTHTIRALEPLLLSPGDAFPAGGGGRFTIDIKDKVGDHLHLAIVVKGKSEDEAGGMMMGA